MDIQEKLERCKSDELDFKGWHDITKILDNFGDPEYHEESINEMLKSITKIRIQDGCMRNKTIQDEFIQVFVNAEYLSLPGCKKLTSNAFINLKNVQYIDLGWCVNIDDNALQYCKNAKHVNLSYCPKITNKGIRLLESVQILNIRFCPNITDEGLKGLKYIRELHASVDQSISGAREAKSKNLVVCILHGFGIFDINTKVYFYNYEAMKRL